MIDTEDTVTTDGADDASSTETETDTFHDEFMNLSDDGSTPTSEDTSSKDTEAPAAKAAESTDATEDTKPDDTASPGKDKDAAPAASSDDENLWVDATEPQKAALAALNHEINSNRGRVTGLQNLLNQARDEASKPAPATVAAVEQRKANEAANSAEFQKMLEEYPEIGGPVGKLIQSQGDKLAEMQQTIDRLSKTQHTVEIHEGQQAIESAHGDWADIKSDFTRWVGEQPSYIQAAAKRNATEIVDPVEANSLISMYKASLPLAQTKPAPEGDNQKPGLDGRRRRRIASAISTDSEGTASADGASPDDYEASFNFHVDKIAKSAQA